MTASFRENLRSELDYQDVTVKELCAKTGIPKATLECYLGARETIPSADAAVRIARALGVSVEYLVTGQDSLSGTAWVMNSRNRDLLRTLDALDDDGCELISTIAKTLKRMGEKRRTPPA